MSQISPSTPMSAAEYLSWERAQTERHEFFKGEVFAMAGGSPRHNALTAAVTMELGVSLGASPCRVLSSDQRVAARDDEHYVYADASVVCGPVLLQHGTNDVLANPSILVEVLSKRTEAYDRGLKWEAYQELESLTDYLLVSQTTPRIEHFVRDAGGWRYGVVGPGGVVSLSNGAVIRVDIVYRGVFELEGG